MFDYLEQWVFNLSTSQLPAKRALEYCVERKVILGNRLLTNKISQKI